MSEFHLIAFDMDGTLLDSKKQVLKSSKIAISEAVKAGKEVAVCSGRNVGGIRPFIKDIPEIRYAISCNGGIVYDLKDNVTLFENTIKKENLDQLIEISQMEDTMIQLLDLESHVQKSHIENMELYHMGIFKESWKKYGTAHDDILKFYENTDLKFVKFCIYHKDTASRQRTLRRIKDSGLPVEAVFSEETSIECTALYTTKAAGLRILCEKIGCDLSSSISVGDSDNDLSVLSAAGLAVAMGNSKECVFKIADAVVADNDHDGCAQAIYKYLI